MKYVLLIGAAVLCFALPARAQEAAFQMPVSRSVRVTLDQPMAQVMIADPRIAGVAVHNSTSLTLFGLRLGRTAVKLSGRDGSVLREFQVTVGYDLPAIRRALHEALPTEEISVEAADASLVLSGTVGGTAVANQAIEAARIALQQHPVVQADGQAAPEPDILNLMQVIPNYAAPAAAPPPKAMERLFLRFLANDANILPAVEGPSGFMLD